MERAMKKVYIIALILALLTGIAVYSFAGALKESSKREYAQVVAAAVNIPERTVLTAEMLVMKSIPIEVVTAGAIRSIDKAVGLFTDNRMEAGEVLSSTKLYTQGVKNSGMKYLIPEGKRAFTLSVDAVSGVGGFILPGDRIDILAIMTMEKKTGEISAAASAGSSTGGTSTVSGAATGAAAQVPTSLIVLQNVEVLAAGANVTVVENGTKVDYTTITLAVTPQEAVALNLTAASGKLRMVLRSPLDDKIVDIKPMTPDLIGNTPGK